MYLTPQTVDSKYKTLTRIVPKKEGKKKQRNVYQINLSLSCIVRDHNRFRPHKAVVGGMSNPQMGENRERCGKRLNGGWGVFYNYFSGFLYTQQRG